MGYSPAVKNAGGGGCPTMAVGKPFGNNGTQSYRAVAAEAAMPAGLPKIGKPSETVGRKALGLRRYALSQPSCRVLTVSEFSFVKKVMV